MRTRRVLALSLLSLLIAVPWLTGCGGKEPEASAPGYYDGPMKAKGDTATKTEDQTNSAGTGN
jgi:hypothetical protein